MASGLLPSLTAPLIQTQSNERSHVCRPTAGGAPSSFGPRGQFIENPLLYTMAVLPRGVGMCLGDSKGGDSISCPKTLLVRTGGGIVTLLPPPDATPGGAAPGGVAGDSLAPESIETVASTFLGALRGRLGLVPQLADGACVPAPLPRGVVCRSPPPPAGRAFRAWEVDAVGRSVLARSKRNLRKTVGALETFLGKGAFFTGDSRAWQVLIDEMAALLEPSLGADPFALAMSRARCAEALGRQLLAAATLVDESMPFPLEHLASVYAPFWVPLLTPLVTGLLYPAV